MTKIVELTISKVAIMSISKISYKNNLLIRKLGQ